MKYQDFLERKKLSVPICGMDVKDINGKLFEFQRDIVRWSLQRGKAAIFADCGMGKTFMQLEWAKHIPGDVLIFAPLSVASQTVREGKKIGITVNQCRKHSDVIPGINIANYEMLEHFDIGKFQGLILDESSVIKSHDGATRNTILEVSQRVPYRLACTATPAPNDYMELGNHAEFLGIMSRAEMLAMFFVHDGGETQKWRLKGHAEDKFWDWVASWAIMIRKPSNLGYDDDGFVLPKLSMHEHLIAESKASADMLFAMPAATLPERLAARRASTGERVRKCAEIVNASKEQWIVWCNLNSEGDALEKSIPGSIQVSGSDSNDKKEESLRGFIDGDIRVLISKVSIFGFGINLQNCRNMAFVGVNDSYEQFYQAVRRCWRFGQKKPVNVHVVAADTEGAVVSNLKRKEEDAEKMAEIMVDKMKKINYKQLHGEAKREGSEYKTGTHTTKRWSMTLGDCVEEAAKIKSDSIHYSVYSPPFSSLYTYSNSDRDMGNSKTAAEFTAHYQFLVKELYRVTMPGRLTSFHCMNLPTSKTNHGFIGIRDFRGDLIRAHEKEGWIYHSEVCIWKDPVTAMQRTKALGLLHKQIKKDSCMSRQGIADYLVTMRKPGDNPERVGHTNESFPVDVWQQYASPVWMDINPNETLQYRSARENNDERHICPLQLEVIRRAVRLWSNPGDTVLSPFAGIGSEGHVALQMGRRFRGIELKESYFNCAVNNLKIAETQQDGLFNETQDGGSENE